MVTFTIVPNNGSGSGDLTVPGEVQLSLNAGVAQLVEHLICNQRVGGSNPFASSSCQFKGTKFRKAGWCAAAPIGRERFPARNHGFPDDSFGAWLGWCHSLISFCYVVPARFFRARAYTPAAIAGAQAQTAEGSAFCTGGRVVR